MRDSVEAEYQVKRRGEIGPLISEVGIDSACSKGGNDVFFSPSRSIGRTVSFSASVPSSADRNQIPFRCDNIALLVSLFSYFFR